MQDRDATQKVDGQPTDREYVPAKKKIVWSGKGGETYDVYLDIGKWVAEHDLEVGRANVGQSGSVDDPTRDGNEPKFFSESWADAAAAGPGVDLRQDAGAGASTQRRNLDLNGGAILNEVIDRLANSNLGPSGFFIIAHRGL